MTSHRKKVCFLSSMHPPFDKRVFDKEATSLTEAGYSVCHVAPDAQDRRETRNGIVVNTYRKRRIAGGRFLDLPKLFVEGWRSQADAYHCNELDSWAVGLVLKMFLRRPVVVDIHEDYPSTVAESRFPPRFRQIVERMVRRYYDIMGLWTDRIVLAKSSIAHDFRNNKDRVVAVKNFTSIQAARSTERTRVHDGRVVAVHLGLISRMRGWPQLLEAIAAAPENVELHVIGTFNDGSKEEFLRKASDLRISSRIRIEDWLPFKEAFQRLVDADIGLVLFQPGIRNHVYALPHKVFDYMLAGLPVVVPDFAQEVAPLVEKWETGILVDPSRPQDIARALTELARDSVLRRRLGENGRAAVHESLNWEAEAVKLVDMYRELIP